MMRMILLAGAATVLGATAAMADASNFQPYMFKQTNDQQPASAAAQGQPAAVANRPEEARAMRPERERFAERTTRRHMRRVAGTEAGARLERVGQTWNPPSQSIYNQTAAPPAWGYAAAPAIGVSAGYYGPGYGYGYGYGYAPAYAGPTYVAAGGPYYGGVVEGRAAYEGPFAAPAAYPAPNYYTPAWVYGYQTMQDPPSASMYFTNTGPY
jgi:hypothetical protein